MRVKCTRLLHVCGEVNNASLADMTGNAIEIKFESNIF